MPPNETLVGYPLAVAGAGVGVGAGLLADDGFWSFGGALRLTVVHAAAVAFLGGVVLLSACLCAQYGHRYRKYQLTAAKEDQETLSLTDNEGAYVLYWGGGGGQGEEGGEGAGRGCAALQRHLRDAAGTKRRAQSALL